MKNMVLRNIGLLLLAVVFSAGLMFAFMELPRLADDFLQSVVGTPSSDPAYDAARVELFYEAYSIRLIGYLCLGLIALFVVLGFTTSNTGWAVAGGAALFLPVFATFAHTMFYLAGLGLLNVILFPFLDISLSLVELGKVVLVPCRFFMWLADLSGWQAYTQVAYLFMGAGSLIFTSGVFTWLQARFENQPVAGHWIYRYSRHPQYLGWIVWSYGLMLYGPSLNQMKKSWGWYATLPWLLSTMVIIGLCMLEELKMKERSGDAYDTYRDRTPFLFPLPGFLSRMIAAPMRLVIRKKRPEKRAEVVLVVLLYLVIFMGLSLFWVDPGSGSDQTIQAIVPFRQERADSIVAEIRRPVHRRYRNTRPFGALISMGPQTHPILRDLMEDQDPDVREIAVRAALDHGIREVIPSIIDRVNDTEGRVVESAVFALGELKAVEAADTLFFLLEHPPGTVRQERLLTTLGKLGDRRILPYLEGQLNDEAWYMRAGALRSMMNIDPGKAAPYLYRSLGDSEPLMRRAVVSILLETLPADAVPHLEKVVDDPDWEASFYARQAIRLIREKHGTR